MRAPIGSAAAQRSPWTAAAGARCSRGGAPRCSTPTAGRARAQLQHSRLSARPGTPRCAHLGCARRPDRATRVRRGSPNVGLDDCLAELERARPVSFHRLNQALAAEDAAKSATRSASSCRPPPRRVPRHQRTALASLSAATRTPVRRCRELARRFGLSRAPSWMLCASSPMRNRVDG